jgi:hypothetical protein
MRSIYGRYPDARHLVSQHPEELAGLLFAYFRSLPWRQRLAVERCVTRAVASYPEPELHAPLSGALMDAWDWLEAEHLLDAATRRAA